MRGLENEWARFADIALQGANDEERASSHLIYMAGAAAATQRFFDLLTSGLPPARQSALIRRIAREMIDYQNQINSIVEQQEEKKGG